MDNKEFKEVEVEESEGMGELVELTDDTGRILKFYHIATLPYLERWFAFFEPAEEIEGTAGDEIVIFEISEQADGQDVLLPVEDEEILDGVYQEFIKSMEDDEDEEGQDEEGCSCGCGCGEDCGCEDENNGGCGCGCH